MISCITSLSYIKKSIQAIKCNRVYNTAVELYMCAHILHVFLYQLTQTVLCDCNPGMLKTLQVRLRATYYKGLGKRGHIVGRHIVGNNVSLFARALMSHSCIAGGCFNTRKDGVSPHKCPEDAHFAKLWKNAVKNTHSDVFNPLISQLCNANFIEDSFEEQSVIAKSLGWNILKPNAVPTILN